jgi:hypothetical protein
MRQQHMSAWARRVAIDRAVDKSASLFQTTFMRARCARRCSRALPCVSRPLLRDPACSRAHAHIRTCAHAHSDNEGGLAQRVSKVDGISRRHQAEIRQSNRVQDRERFLSELTSDPLGIGFACTRHRAPTQQSRLCMFATRATERKRPQYACAGETAAVCGHTHL